LCVLVEYFNSNLLTKQKKSFNSRYFSK